MDVKTLKENFLMNTDTFEATFVLELYSCSCINTEIGRETLRKVKKSAREELREVLMKSTPSEDRVNELISIIENQTIDITRFLPHPATDTAIRRIKSFVDCRSLFSIFVAAFFDQPSPDSLYTLNAYSAAAGAGFFSELVYLYLLRVDSSARVAVHVAMHEAEDHFSEPIDGIVEEDDDDDDDDETNNNNNNGRQKRIKFDPELVTAKTRREFYEIFLRPEGMAIDSRCPLKTRESCVRLGKLVFAIPFILCNWDKLPVEHYSKLYRGISNFSNKLHPQTPLGLYVHLQFFTPTHLRKTFDAIFNLIKSNG